MFQLSTTAGFTHIIFTHLNHTTQDALQFIKINSPNATVLPIQGILLGPQLNPIYHNG